MTTSHTPGRLKIGRIDHENQHVEIDAESTRAYLNCFPWENLATCYGEESNPERGSAVMQANARRLVAAWNATIGIPTEMLEAASNAEKVEPTWQDQKDQIDELITALAACRDAMPPSSVDISEAVGYPTSVPAYVRESVALLVAQRDELQSRCAEWEKKAATWLASPEAAQRLEGYRDLTQQLNTATAQRDELLEALKEVVPILEAILMIRGEPEPGSIGFKARAAIAKVQGGEA